MKYACRILQPIQSYEVTVDATSGTDAAQEMHLVEVLAGSCYRGLAHVFEAHSRKYAVYFVVVEVAGLIEPVISRIFSMHPSRVVENHSLINIARELGWKEAPENLMQSSWGGESLWEGEEKVYHMGPAPGRVWNKRSRTDIERMCREGEQEGQSQEG